MSNDGSKKTKILGSLQSPARAPPARSEAKTVNEELDKGKTGSLGPLLPIALAELLISKGIITKKEVDKAISKTVLEIINKQKAIKSKPHGGKGGKSRERKG